MPPLQVTTEPTQQTKTVVLAGNPNVGKSVVFNALSGRYADVSNFPGTTVDITKGQLANGWPLQDTPGVYGLSDYSEEEVVAAKAILAADIVVNVVAAPTLERDLFLTQQILDYQKPMLLVVNQMDEAERRGIQIDLNKLSNLLGIKVIATVATQNQGLSAITHQLDQAQVGNPMPDCPSVEQLKAIETQPAKRLELFGHRRRYVNALVSQTVKYPEKQAKTVTEKLGKLVLNPVFGLASLLLILAVLYQVIGVWVAGDLVDLLEGKIFLEHVIPFIQSGFAQVLPKDSALFKILAGEFGLFTMTIQYLLGVMLPLVLSFYVYISLLEDCGYLPRVAVLADGLLNKIGLNGRAVIPIILGFGCVTMASVSTRVLTSQRERTIASVILAITVPCSAQIGVVVGLMAIAGGLMAWGVYLIMLTIVLTLLGTFLNQLLPGKSTSLIMDLPPMRFPQLKNIAKKTWVRSLVFLKEAMPLFVVGALLVSIADVTGLLDASMKALSPITVNLLHLPEQTGQMFVMGMVRRDFGAAGLYMLAEQLTASQIVTALMVITLFVPCFASATVIWKERGTKESLAILLGSWLVAFGVGGIACRFLEWTHLLS